MTDFDPFFKDYGPPEHSEMPDEALLRTYRPLVPPIVLEFWERFGFSSYADGFLWVVDPRRFQDALQPWVAEKGAPATPIIRGAFGEFIYWQRDKFLMLDPNYNDTFELGADAEVIFVFYVCGEKGRNGVFRERLFKKALKKFGRFHVDEMYGFKLPLAMGGERDLKNVEKMKLKEQLSILAQVHGV